MRLGSASLSASITSGPHRLVVFINVVGCGIFSPSGTRQNRRHDNESAASLTTASNDRPCLVFKNISRRYVSTGMLGRPQIGSKNFRYGSKNTGSSSNPSTATSSAAISRHSAGSSASHRVRFGFTVTNTMASIPSCTRG